MDRATELILEWLKGQDSEAVEIISSRGSGTDWDGDTESGFFKTFAVDIVYLTADGTRKHRTTVGKGAKTGANNTFVAPVTIGDGAMTGGGAVVRRDVPPGNLAVSGGPQRNLDRRLPRDAPTSMGDPTTDEGES